MSAESAHLSKFGAETETEAEIRSTSNIQWTANYQRVDYERRSTGGLEHPPVPDPLVNLYLLQHIIHRVRK